MSFFPFRLIGRMRIGLLIAFILLLLGGCQSSTAPISQPEKPSASQLPASGQPVTVTGNGAQQATGTDAPLTLWVPPFFSINTTNRADAVLAAALAESAPTGSGSSVTVVPKAERGTAGLLAYLLTAQRAAPALLPDIVLINSYDLPRVVSAGIVSPLSDQESRPFAGIPPALLAGAEVDGLLSGLPFVANLEHLVYQKKRMPIPPTRLTDILEREQRLLFAGGTVDEYSLSFAWTLYLMGGGGIDDQRRLTSPEAMAAVFDFLRSGRERGLIPDATLTLSSAQAVWTFFANGDAEMAVVPASLFYNQQGEVGEIGFAPLPSLDGQPRSVVTTWSFAVVTQIPARRQQALRLLQQLFEPQLHGEWSWSARQLPTQPDALAYWDTGDPYTLFLQEMLTDSVSSPNPHSLGELTRAVQQAQKMLLAGEISTPAALDALPFGP